MRLKNPQRSNSPLSFKPSFSFPLIQAALERLTADQSDALSSAREIRSFELGCALVVCRISGSGIRKAVLRPIRIMNDKGRYYTLMDITMPASFPETEFRAFGIAASNFFPGLLSDEVLYDPQERRRHFDLSWQAVRYRYRSCTECSDEFKALLDSSSEMLEYGDGVQERWINYLVD